MPLAHRWLGQLDQMMELFRTRQLAAIHGRVSWTIESLILAEAQSSPSREDHPTMDRASCECGRAPSI